METEAQGVEASSHTFDFTLPPPNTTLLMGGTHRVFFDARHNFAEQATLTAQAAQAHFGRVGLGVAAVEQPAPPRALHCWLARMVGSAARAKSAAKIERRRRERGRHPARARLFELYSRTNRSRSRRAPVYEGKAIFRIYNFLLLLAASPHKRSYALPKF